MIDPRITKRAIEECMRRTSVYPINEKTVAAALLSKEFTDVFERIAGEAGRAANVQHALRQYMQSKRLDVFVPCIRQQATLCNEGHTMHTRLRSGRCEHRSGVKMSVWLALYQAQVRSARWFDYASLRVFFWHFRRGINRQVSDISGIDATRCIVFTERAYALLLVCFPYFRPL